ncbi:hypothetical protein L3049_07060 [Labilibaculum sp. DW002]|jgi:hypothetical protein|uniref:Uncharacterized protein n=1 Tax=Paralabilibaculum antarcticum TaxID=2912572 RepID=A0ABT5VU30_9BACT|nr:hypothetical protein [Labilibaculum sp. DW002]MDE5417764.1 hypothetical protein [Labilibaculum sp. DW002]
MRRFYSLKDMERERYRLYLEKELVVYKLKYFYRNTRESYRLENIVKDSVGTWLGKFISRLIWKKNNSEMTKEEIKTEV